MISRLTSFFKENAIVEKFDKFLGSYLNIFIIAITSFFIWTIGLYNGVMSVNLFLAIYLLYVGFTAVFASDGKAFMPLLMMCMVTFSKLPDTGVLPIQFVLLAVFSSIFIVLFIAKKYFVYKDIKLTFGQMNKSLVLLAIILLLSTIINIFAFPSVNNLNGLLLTILFIGLTFFSIVLNMVSSRENTNYKESYVNYIFVFLEMVLILEFFVSIFYSYSLDGKINFYLTNLGWGNRNTFGKLSCICLLFTYLEFLKAPKKSFFLIVLFAVGSVPVLISNSRGAQASLMVLILFMLIYTIIKFKKHYILILEIYTFLFIATICLVICFPSVLKAFTRLFEEGVSLNGRNDIYNAVFNEIFSNPIKAIFGGSTTFLYDLSPIYNVNPGNTFLLCHNTYVTAIAATGILGLVGLIIHQFEMFYDVVKYTKNDERNILLVLLAFAVLFGLIDNAQFELSFSIPLIVVFANMPYKKGALLGYKLKENIQVNK